jgi:hypothetical protein
MMAIRGTSAIGYGSMRNLFEHCIEAILQCSGKLAASRTN